jgi:hypothetical protein
VGDATHSGNLKISKGEESNFIWGIFYALLEQVIGVLNVPEPENRETNDFDLLEYVFFSGEPRVKAGLGHFGGA